MSRHLRLVVTALGAALPLPDASAQPARPPSREVVAARVDSMVRDYMAAKGPASVSIAISRGGETLVQRAWGLADVAANRPATAGTVCSARSSSASTARRTARWCATRSPARSA